MASGTDPAVEQAIRSSLMSFLDKRLLIILRDGAHLIGTLRTYDQYNNIVLTDCSERDVAGEKYVDEKQEGLYVIRGENIVLFGEIDSKIEQKTVKEVSREELERYEKELEAKNIEPSPMKDFAKIGY
eukprot:CAMPEP_0167751128 /NCGR_PEP_ID=MMETSP0110_2-20121227/6385_1 /TAXON_ID=629695 /ORGANISM="Gymnochlora sp., Strain CCMP2014" /LENGTH=127 /DNA_ID=CAMNT_0007636547 /DNA_START=33 /DNA_END=416 /DNA_ORIENTATION=+